MELAGRVAVVTGGSSGIGAACVERLREEGAHPVVWDLRAQGEAVRCDVGDPDAVAAAHTATTQRWGLPSVLVTAAGIGGFSLVADMDLEDWERVLRVNLTGTMLCLRAFGAALQDAGQGGAAVTVTSVNGRIPDRGMAAYCCSKAAVDMLTRVAAAELGPAGIRVNAVAPGVTDTPLLAAPKQMTGFEESIRGRTPLGGRLGSAGDVAGAVMALLGADWVTGQILAADGGLGLASPIDPMGLMGGRGR